MTELFNNILSNVSSNLTVGSALVTLTVAILFGIFVAFTYYKIQDDASYQQSLAITLVILPAILSIIILFTGSNIAPVSYTHLTLPTTERV